jgi:hypothetical protein
MECYHFYQLSDGLYSGTGCLADMDLSVYGYTDVDIPDTVDSLEGYHMGPENRYWTGTEWEIR